MRWSRTLAVASATSGGGPRLTYGRSFVRGVVLVDTGPLVALFDPSDRARNECRATLATLERADLVTTEAVITEATFLLDFSVDAQVALQVLLAAGSPRVVSLEPRDRARIAALTRKYRDLPMDYADATLVALAERLGTTAVFPRPSRLRRLPRGTQGLRHPSAAFQVTGLCGNRAGE